MKLDKTILHRGETLTITADVTNTGSCDGEEVVQLYIRDLAGSVTRPVKELKGFRKIALKKGETQQVCFELTESNLAILDIQMTRRAESGDFKVWVSSHSADEKSYRSGADPSVVEFRGEYYMFVTRSMGYWHSTDLLNWDFKPMLVD